MSWSVEFLQARRRLLQSDDYRAQRALGHELNDATMDTPLGSDVPFRVRFQCRFCGAVIEFMNSEWSSDGVARWKLRRGIRRFGRRIVPRTSRTPSLRPDGVRWSLF